MPRDASVGKKIAKLAEPLDLDIAIARGAVRLEAKLSIAAGVTVLVGASGAGKSTLLEAIAGLARPSRGTIRVAGELWFDSTAKIDLPPEARRVGFVFQSPALFPHMTAIENVRYGAPKKKSSLDARSRAAALLERFCVAELADRKPRQLSGGEAQRVALARAIAREPRVLLLDEPFSALDPPLREALAAEVARCANEFSIPTLVVTHDREDAARLGGRVVRLESGANHEVGRVVDETLLPRVDSPPPAS